MSNNQKVICISAYYDKLKCSFDVICGYSRIGFNVYFYVIGRTAPAPSHSYRQQFVDVGEVVGAAMLALHFPRLLPLALNCELDGFQTVAVAYVVNGFHEDGTLWTVRYRVEEVRLRRIGWRDVAHDDARFLVENALTVDVCEYAEGCGGDFQA